MSLEKLTFGSPVRRLMSYCRTSCCTGPTNLYASNRVRRLSNTTRVCLVVPKVFYRGSDRWYVQDLSVNSVWRLRKHIDCPHHPHRSKLSPCSRVRKGNRPLLDTRKCPKEIIRFFPQSIRPPPRFLSPSPPQHKREQYSSNGLVGSWAYVRSENG